MNKKSLSVKTLILSLGLIVSSAMNPLAASESINDKIDDLISSCPWVGLIADKVTYGPVTIRKVDIEDSGKLVFAQPGEKIEGTLKYKIDASKLDSWDLHHIVVGLRKGDAQNCIVHSLGVWDKKGKASFSLEAPNKKGTYEICLGYYQASLCSNALDEWAANPPDHSATIGILVVE